MDENDVFFEGRPHQVVNIGRFFICLVVFILACSMKGLWEEHAPNNLESIKGGYFLVAKLLFFLSPAFALHFWLRVYFHVYTISSASLHERTGILSKHTEVMELYRVKDMTLDEPANLRLFGCGNIILETSDRSHPILVLQAVSNPTALIDKLRHHVETMRQLRGVREID